MVVRITHECMSDTDSDVREALDEDEAASEGLFDGQYAVSEDELVREDTGDEDD
jgi:hypothetical protein